MSGDRIAALLPEGFNPEREAARLMDDGHVASGRRLAVAKSAWLSAWFVSYSPRNCNESAEGPWEDWVALAAMILAMDPYVRAALAEAEADHA